MAKPKRCPCCKQVIPEKPRVKIITVDGISYTRYHWKDGMTVESPCKCFGAVYRAHSTHDCPWLKKRRAAEKAAHEAKEHLSRLEHLLGLEESHG